MKIINAQQGSQDWLISRAGIVTASELDSLVTPRFEIRTGQTPETYMIRKITERLFGLPMELLDPQPTSYAMDQGKLAETIALPWLEAVHGYAVERVGLCVTDDGRVGASPDGLIGEDGGIELKFPRPAQHVRYLIDGGLPPDYRAQVHCSMFVTGRPWWLFMSFSTHEQTPPLLVKVARDEKIIATIAQAVDVFYESLEEKMARVKALIK